MIESCWRCGTLTTVVNGRCEKCNLDLSEEEKTDITEDEGWLRHQERMQTDDPANEKRRRVYYQDIVYAVCNRLDKVAFGTTVCGSWAEPSTNVQDRLDDVIQRWSDARDRIESLEAEIKALRYVTEQRNAWRAACRYLYEVIGEGGSKGRPLDLIAKGDYGRIIAMIGKAESMEEGSGVCHCGLPMDAFDAGSESDGVDD